MMRWTIGQRKSRLVGLGFAVAVLITLNDLPSTSAGELNPARVPADAQWLVHIDYESLSDSAMWQKIRDEKPLVSKMIQGRMKKRFGIDPTTDLKSITMFSRDYQEYTGTAIVDAEYDTAKIEERFSKAINHRTTTWRDHTLHTITVSEQPTNDEPSSDEEMTVVMMDKNTLLLASSVSKAQETLTLLAGDAPSLKDKESALLTDHVNQAWIYGAAINLGKLSEHPISMPIIAQHQQINWSFGSRSDGELYETAKFVAQSEDVAKKLKTVLDGLVAFESLRSDESEALAAIVEDIEIERDGKTTSFQWKGSSDQVVAAMDDVFARMETWKPFIMKHRQRPGN